MDTAHAILIRAIEPLDGIEHMLVRRRMVKASYRLTAGPGSLSCALGITKKHSGLSLTADESPVWIEHPVATSTEEVNTTKEEVIASPRIGVGYSEESASWPWRFRIKDNPWTSPAK